VALDRHLVSEQRLNTELMVHREASERRLAEEVTALRRETGKHHEELLARSAASERCLACKEAEAVRECEELQEELRVSCEMSEQRRADEEESFVEKEMELRAEWSSRFAEEREELSEALSVSGKVAQHELSNEEARLRREREELHDEFRMHCSALESRLADEGAVLRRESMLWTHAKTSEKRLADTGEEFRRERESLQRELRERNVALDRHLVSEQRLNTELMVHREASERRLAEEVTALRRETGKHHEELLARSAASERCLACKEAEAVRECEELQEELRVSCEMSEQRRADEEESFVEKEMELRAEWSSRFAEEREELSEALSVSGKVAQHELSNEEARLRREREELHDEFRMHGSALESRLADEGAVLRRECESLHTKLHAHETRSELRLSDEVAELRSEREGCHQERACTMASERRLASEEAELQRERLEFRHELSEQSAAAKRLVADEGFELRRKHEELNDEFRMHGMEFECRLSDEEAGLHRECEGLREDLQRRHEASEQRLADEEVALGGRCQEMYEELGVRSSALEQHMADVCSMRSECDVLHGELEDATKKCRSVDERLRLVELDRNTLNEELRSTCHARCEAVEAFEELEEAGHRVQALAAAELTNATSEEYLTMAKLTRARHEEVSVSAELAELRDFEGLVALQLAEVEDERLELAACSLENEVEGEALRVVETRLEHFQIPGAENLLEAILKQEESRVLALQELGEMQEEEDLEEHRRVEHARARAEILDAIESRVRRLQDELARERETHGYLARHGAAMLEQAQAQAQEHEHHQAVSLLSQREREQEQQRSSVLLSAPTLPASPMVSPRSSPRLSPRASPGRSRRVASVEDGATSAVAAARAAFVVQLENRISEEEAKRENSERQLRVTSEELDDIARVSRALEAEAAAQHTNYHARPVAELVELWGQLDTSRAELRAEDASARRLKRELDDERQARFASPSKGGDHAQLRPGAFSPVSTPTRLRPPPLTSSSLGSARTAPAQQQTPPPADASAVSLSPASPPPPTTSAAAAIAAAAAQLGGQATSSPSADTPIFGSPPRGASADDGGAPADLPDAEAHGGGASATRPPPSPGAAAAAAAAAVGAAEPRPTADSAHAMPAGTPPADRTAEAPPPSKEEGCYMVRINRSDGDPLGIDLNSTTLEIEGILDSGLVNTWNGAVEDAHLTVHTGDRIAQVNGKRGAESIIAELREYQVLEIMVARKSGTADSPLPTSGSIASSEVSPLPEAQMSSSKSQEKTLVDQRAARPARARSAGQPERGDVSSGTGAIGGAVPPKPRSRRASNEGGGTPPVPHQGAGASPRALLGGFANVVADEGTPDGRGVLPPRKAPTDDEGASVNARRIAAGGAAPPSRTWSSPAFAPITKKKVAPGNLHKKNLDAFTSSLRS